MPQGKQADPDNIQHVGLKYKGMVRDSALEMCVIVSSMDDAR